MQRSSWTSWMGRCLVGVGLLFAAGATQAQVTLERQDQTVAVKIDGKDFTTYHFSSDLPKPYFSPVMAADGAVVTRPINDPADKDHPHHKGIWTSVDEVNKIKFWAEKGKIVNAGVELVTPSGNPAVMKVVNHWLGEDGKPVLVETTKISIHANRLMVFEIALAKGEAPVEFEDTKEGLFGVRVATSMREKVGGTILNAAGETTMKNCWGKPSPWVDYSGPVAEKTYGVAIFDSPKNFRPSRHHVRDYGLFSVSPFGEGAYQNDASKKQLVHLDDQHPSLKLTYGIYIHSGDAAAGKVAETYGEFVKLLK
ncbi:PmoA family protein [Planctellipticum variicoloris]|uniref:DUF6807 domain-containing protein n=1 Tax=Planctellipticum variicoloris TaxID=3064265 RepID=UPI00301326F7|nr:PmoA family protein [Planctomycetaceae bacterium SH412]